MAKDERPRQAARSPGSTVAWAGLIVVAILAGLAIFVLKGSRLRASAGEPVASPAASQSAAAPLPKPSPMHREEAQASPAVAPAAPLAPMAAAPTGLAAVASPALPPPAAPVVPALPLGVSMAANRDGMNNGCKHGALVFGATTMRFTCPSDASKNVAVQAAEVIAADGNGILVAPKQKYHFDIGGMRKEQTQELFARWLENARTSTSRN